MASQFRPPVSPKPVRRTASCPLSNPEYDDDAQPLYDDVIHVRQSLQKAPSPLAARPKNMSPVTKRKNSPIYDDIVSTKENIAKPLQQVPPAINARPKQHMSPVTERRNSPLPSNTAVPTITEPLKKIPPAVATKPMSPVTKRKNGPIYYDIVSAENITKPLQQVPPTVNARPKQYISPVTEQRNSPLPSNTDVPAVTEPSWKIPPAVAPKPMSPVTKRKSSPIYDDIVSTKYITKSLQKVPSPVTTRPKQNISPVVEQKVTPDGTALAKESTTKRLQKVPPPVAARPKHKMSPVTERRNSYPLHSDKASAASTVTKPSQKDPFEAFTRLPQHKSPAITEQSNSSFQYNYIVPNLNRQVVTTFEPSVTAPSKQHSSSNTEEDIPLYDDIVSVMPSPTQKFAPPILLQSMPSGIKRCNADLLSHKKAS